MIKPLRILTAILALSMFTLVGCDVDGKESATPRYSAQSFTIAGGLSVFTQITDHELNKLYYYELIEKQGLVLQSTIDLNKTGDDIIPGKMPKKDKAEKAGKADDADE